MKAFIIRLLSILFITSFSIVLFWHYFPHSDEALNGPRGNQNPANSNDAAASNPRNVKQNPAKRMKSDFIDKLLASYSISWEKQNQNIQTYRSLLGSSCNAISNAVVTQVNSPVGTNITYDADQKKIMEVTPALFNLFPKESPFEKAPWDSCAVVGNGGILANSSCGKQIDSATYVIRCNLPPLSNGHERDTGRKTHLVTANPSILFQNVAPLTVPPDVKQNAPDVKQNAPDVKQNAPDVKQNPASSKEKAIIDKLLASYTYKWKKQDKNIKSFRSSLGSSCNAISNAVVTQGNSPVGTNITYDADQKRKIVVTPALFSLFPKESPFEKAPWDSCAVIGNGGVLANSSCGKQIDSATFVIRCNLPPLSSGHERNVGNKTHLVTANPSIFFQKYRSLNERRRPFVEDMRLYGDALLLLPAFSFGQNTAVSLRVLYSLEDFSKHGPRAVFFNPAYLKSLAGFWRGQGIRSLRLSTGIMMASLALELCNNVHLYGFWPFGTHPYTHQPLTNHYYDNQPANKRMHAMPAEFEALLNLHNKGVIHLHLGECTN